MGGFTELEMSPAEVRRRFRWARRQGRPAWLWPQVRIEAWREALADIERAVRAALAGQDAPALLDGDPAAISVAAYTSGTGPLLGLWAERGRLWTSPVVGSLLALHLD